MLIVYDAEKVLHKIYNALTEDSSEMKIKINMAETAKEINMSVNHLNLCLYYLTDAEYIECDHTYKPNEPYEKEITIKYKGINKAENRPL